MFGRTNNVVEEALIFASKYKRECNSPTRDKYHHNVPVIVEMADTSQDQYYVND